MASTLLNVNDDATFRPLGHFPPSIWGDRFLHFSLDQSTCESYGKSIEVLKEEVKGLLVDTSINDWSKKLNMIYSIHRLGLSYHFEEQIDAQLNKHFHQLKELEEDYEGLDLYTTSLHFQVFRHHGYKMPCEVFNKFKDTNTGKFKENIVEDVKGLLSLYEATQLRVRGEEMLDKALQFTQTHLKKIMEMEATNNLSPNLVKQIHQVLEGGTFHKGMQIVEAWLYLSIYEQDSSKNDTILKLAKFNFNYLQLLHKEELRIVSKWWKDMEFASKLCHVKERVAEIYMSWSLGLYFESCYSIGRIFLAKFVLLLVVIDDTYDAYGTVEEIRLFTDAVNRWDVKAMDQLPEYMKFPYSVLINFFDELEEHLASEGRSYAFQPTKQALQELVGAYFVEAKWFLTNYVASFDEYMKIALVSSAQKALSIFALAVMGEKADEDAFLWLKTQPPIITSVEIIGRLQDDIETREVEQGRGQTTSGMECYMKTYGVSEKETIEEYDKMIENAWKDVNEECLKPTPVSMNLLTPILNLPRVMDMVYKYGDGLTHAGGRLKRYITLLFITPVPLQN